MTLETKGAEWRMSNKDKNNTLTIITASSENAFWITDLLWQVKTHWGKHLDRNINIHEISVSLWHIWLSEVWVWGSEWSIKASVLSECVGALSRVFGHCQSVSECDETSASPVLVMVRSWIIWESVSDGCCAVSLLYSAFRFLLNVAN